MRANPEDDNRKHVQNEKHDWHHDRHEPGDEERVVGQFRVGFIEAIFFELLHIEGTDDQHAGEILAGDQVQPVNELLHDAEPGQRNGNEGDDHADQDNHSQGNGPPHGGAGIHGADNAADTQNGRIKDQAHGDHGHRLQLGDIVGVARDQRGGGELIEFGAGEARDLLEDITTQVACAAGGDLGRKIADADAA